MIVGQRKQDLQVSSRFEQELKRRVLVFDGAMGTSIQQFDLDLDRDYLGKENCSEVLLQTRPDVITWIHESYLKVGADAVETDTFGANRLVLAEFDMVDQAYQLNKTAAELAREVCDRYSTSDKPRFVIGSIGPGTKLLTLGHTTWELMFDSYAEQAKGLIDGGADVLLIETAQDLLQVKCAINACIEALKRCGKTVSDVPVMVQVTVETTGTMLLGTDIAAAATALKPFPILSLGMNCATGPVEMAEHVNWLGSYWPRVISLLPNAGLPVLVDGRTEYPLKPGPFAEKVVEYIERAGVNIVGGCCGTTPEHIAELVRSVGSRESVRVGKQPLKPGCSSLYSTVEYRQESSILNVGERTNASGSRAFKRLLESEAWDEMVSLARSQMREGSHLVDINVDYAGRDNPADMAEFVGRVVQQVNVPLMLDSTQPATIEAGLKRAPGKCLINSANLEEGEEKFAALCDLARRYGAGLVLGTIDEDPEEAMARTADRKEAIAARMHELATKHYGLAEEDLFFDPLVLPVSTGMEKDRRSALETIEGTRRIARRFPNCQLTCGVSNVSFGLKPAARQVLNSVFLNELIEAGMVSAIVHVTKLLPRTRISDERLQAALDLIYDRRADEPVTLRDGNRTTDPLQIFIDLFADAQAQTAPAKQDISRLAIEERLQRHIIDGEKQGLIETLDEAKLKYTPIEIINDHLLAGMKVVGEMFGSGRMQLPFVLQSAEVMKAAVTYLEQFMEKVEGQSKGSIVLATVKGDVHDIGKNLVDIILSNNGFTVYNIGIKQPINTIIEAWERHRADAIGLSGLLVKSVAIMEQNLHELNDRAIRIPVLLGGAALSKHYCDSHLRGIYRGRVYHGRDAFEGLRIMDHLTSGKLVELDNEIDRRLEKRAKVESKLQAKAPQKSDGATAGMVKSEPQVTSDVMIPQPPFWGVRVVTSVPLDQVYPYINEVALFRGQWQFKKGSLTEEQYRRQLEDDVKPLFEQLKHRMRAENILQPCVVYGYFPCNSKGGDLIIYDPDDHQHEIERFTFPRQSKGKGQCISDFFLPVDAGRHDVIGLHCVTVGSEVSRLSRSHFEANDYRQYLYIHGLGVETAEAMAELWHKRMRQELGIDIEDAANIRDLFTQHYRGSRYSFGYPACPDLSDQEKLFRLLQPERIGCRLTENWQIDPEQSTSAIVVHHPQAKYFSV